MFAKDVWMMFRSIVANITVEPILFLFMLSLFTNKAVFQDMIFIKLCLTQFNQSICNRLDDPNMSSELGWIQERSAHWFLLCNVFLTIPSLVAVAYLGSLGDNHSKKLPLFLPSIGGMMNMIVYIVMAADHSTPLWVALLGNVLGGCFGGYIATISASMSYLTCVTDESTRMGRMAVAESMIFLGGTVGPIVSGSIIRKTGHVSLFSITLCCYAILTLYTILCIKEIKPEVSELGRKEAPTQDEMAKSGQTNKTANGDGLTNTTQAVRVTEERVSCLQKYLAFKHFMNSLKICCLPRPNGQRTNLLLLLLAFVIAMTIHSGEEEILYLFVKDAPIFMDFSTYNYLIGFKFLLVAIALVLVHPVTMKFQISDCAIAIVGTISRSISMIYLGLSVSTLMVIFFPVIGVFSFFINPAIRSLVSKIVHISEEAKMQANVSILENVCLLIGSVSFYGLYPPSRMFFNGFLLHTSALMLLIPLAVFIYVHRNMTPKNHPSEKTNHPAAIAKE